ncbi:cytochrome b/b6 domain-containing protein [Neptunomonas phycophila]|uniref:cytochrome b/b6 domain-containing protein n=1 Tax=Neptunomonas phycophila TaxID=1572645 RepID=UPI0026E3ADD2|nr:cytochrome b/b6 domain-containing protein [Neptunomonas phycophila]MDO6468797.1 cytochrome b/b6 domain-containing protein [Neptunomonas phycophila]
MTNNSQEPQTAPLTAEVRTKKTVADTETSSKPQPERTIKVWDISVRLLHWMLVLGIGFLWYSGETGGNIMTWHMYVGYLMLGLVTYRVIWGLIGSKYARFGAFLTGPFVTMKYAALFLVGREKHYLSHNPLGSWMVFILLLLVLIQASTGLFATDDIFTEGPLYALIPSDIADILTRIHKLNFNILLACIGAHVFAVLIHAVFKRDKLIKAMFTGNKVTHDPHAISIKEPFIRIGITAIIAFAAVYSLLQLG